MRRPQTVTTRSSMHRHPFRRVLGVLVVVVAADIEDGRGGEAGEEGEKLAGRSPQASTSPRLRACACPDAPRASVPPDRRAEESSSAHSLCGGTDALQRNQPLGDVVQLVHRGNPADDISGEVIHQDDLLRGQRHVGRDVNLTG